MRAIVAHLLAPALCLGLFLVTCPLTAPAAPPAAEQPKCCAFSEASSECSPSEHGVSTSERCCVSHGCTSVIAVAAAPLFASRIDAPQLSFGFAQAIAARAEKPPVPPPRSASN